MLVPFMLQAFAHRPFSLSINDVNLAWVRLQKAVDAVDCLNEVIKLVVNPDKDGAMAKTLEIAARTADFFFCCKM